MQWDGVLQRALDVSLPPYLDSNVCCQVRGKVHERRIEYKIIETDHHRKEMVASN